MPKLQEAKGRYNITIPLELIKLKKWRKGQDLVLGFNQDGDILIRSIPK
jgi:hypothetical protein